MFREAFTWLRDGKRVDDVTITLYSTFTASGSCETRADT